MRKILLALLVFSSVGSVAVFADDSKDLDNYVDSVKQNRDDYKKNKQEQQQQNANNNTQNNTSEGSAVNSVKPIDLGTIILGEFVGFFVPGFGISHFIVGDTGGGVFCLGITGASILLYGIAETGIESKIIDSPFIYNTLRYTGLGLFIAGWLYDLIGAPIYYTDYNNKLKVSISTMEPSMVCYQEQRPDLKLDLIKINCQY